MFLMEKTSPRAEAQIDDIDADELDGGLPPSVEDALSYSAGYAQRYFAAHTPSSTDLEDHQAAVLAAARLEWLLPSLRSEISGLFSKRDILMLLNCVQDSIFFPGSFERLASDLCDDLGVELDKYERSGIASLVDKLLALTAGQSLALADALEQAWHVGMPANLHPAELFPQLGIELI
jgi:hypothetical protein